MKNILLLFGGESPEHSVSVVSAGNVAAAIDQSKYTVHYGYIDRQGRWWLVDKVVNEQPEGSSSLYPDLGNARFIAVDQPLDCDVILPILHGANGEDGTVQALGQLLHLPVVGCGMTASDIAMQKHHAKAIAQQHGIPVVPYRLVRGGESTPDFDTVATELGQTLFVKPSGAGSSVGVSKVTNAQQFDSALAAAFAVDDTVLIERAVPARELEVAVLGNPPDAQASSVGEIVPDGDFYSFDSKYSDSSSSRAVIPAELTTEQIDTIRAWALQLFTGFDGRGMARVDFFLDKESGQLYFNEMNTIPGFTDISMYPKLWQHDGIGYSQLIDRLISAALAQ